MVAHAAAVVARTHVDAQDTEVLVVNTELEIFESMLEEGLVSQIKMDWWNNSDPYLEVIAYDYLGNSSSQTYR